MSILIEFEHDLGDKVEIKAIQTVGIVKELIKERHGLRYSVTFWNEGKREIEYVYGEEIRRAES